MFKTHNIECLPVVKYTTFLKYLYIYSVFTMSVRFYTAWIRETPIDQNHFRLRLTMYSYQSHSASGVQAKDNGYCK